MGIPSNKWGAIKESWQDLWAIDDSATDGHVSRNIRIALFVVDMVQPYVRMQKIEENVRWNA